MTQQNTRYTWIYSTSRLQSFPPLTTRFRGSRDRKVKKRYCKFEFRLNCKQRFTFHQGPIHVKGHLHKMFRFPSPDRPIFLEKQRKNSESLVKKQVL